MKFRSALEDFCAGLGASFADPLARLAYVCRLRTDTGEYEHWGLAKVHGRGAAQRAMAEGHSNCFLDLLRTPLRNLDAAGTAESLAEMRYQPEDILIPGDLRGGSKRHFSSVLRALQALAKANTRPAASPPRPPDR